jgi:hypothetical protein
VRKLPGGIRNQSKAVMHAFRGRWWKLSEIAEILRCTPSEAHRKLNLFAKASGDYTLLVREGSADIRILVFPKADWQHLLKLLRRIPE